MTRRSLAERAQRFTRWGFGHGIPMVATRVRARRGDLQAQLIHRTRTSPELPVDLFEQVHAAGPFYRGRFASVTSRLDVVREVLASPDVRAGFAVEGAGAAVTMLRWSERSAPLGPITPPSLLATEPPDHTRMRKLVTRVFTVRAVERLRERAEQISHRLIDDIERTTDGDRPVDLVETYAAQLPVTMICQILGVDEHEQDVVRRFGTEVAPSLDLGLALGRFGQVENSLLSFDAWLREHVDLKRREPGDDLLSQLVAARDEDGRSLSDEELISVAGLVLAAGFETTVNLLGNGTALLAEHPEQRAALLAGDASWANAVEEALRFDSPVLLTARTTTRPTEIAGERFGAGQILVTALAGANRDPDVFTDPHRFDVDRENAGDHVAFSSGRHYCLGAALARMEGEVGLQALHERLADIRVAPGAERRDTRILRGYATLPVTFSRS